MRYLIDAICFLVAIAGSGCALISSRPSVTLDGAGIVTIPYREDSSGRPVVTGSINGTRGKFLIDTGASGPLLLIKAVRECAIPISPRTKRAGFIADEAPQKFRYVEGEVNIELDGLTITWANPAVAAGLGSETWFGLIDYQTLKAGNAVINTKEKTVTFTMPLE